MSEITRQVKINAPKEKTWEILADFGAVSNWAPAVTESHITTEAKRGVGAIRICHSINKRRVFPRRAPSVSSGVIQSHDKSLTRNEELPAA